MTELPRSEHAVACQKPRRRRDPSKRWETLVQRRLDPAADSSGRHDGPDTQPLTYPMACGHITSGATLPLILTSTWRKILYRPVVTVCTAQWSLCTAQWSLYVPPSGHYMYRTVVTVFTVQWSICTAQWSLYVPHSGHYSTAQWSLYVPPI